MRPKTWAGLTLDRAVGVLCATTNQGLHAAAKRRGTVIVDSWRTHADGTPVDPPPSTSDARDWDAWRARHGYSGVHH